MIEASGVALKNPRPRIGELALIIGALNTLNGERHAPELPVPNSAIRAYAARVGLGPSFITLVACLDNEIMAAFREAHEAKQGGT